MKNGIIEIEDINFIISPSLKESDFLESSMNKTSELVLKNAHYHTYESGPHKVKGTLFYLSIVFFHANIFSVSMRCYDPNTKNIYDERLTDYIDDEILIDKELLIKKEHDDWFFKNLGHKKAYTFSWGSIESTFEKKTCSASIVFNYKGEMETGK